jgi:TIR domain
VRDVEPEYDVCLSFAGEQRTYVLDVADALRSSGIRVFYDQYERAAFWGKDLYEHLDWVYRKAARYCLVFISSDYAAKVWTTHERRSAQARALEESREYVLPVRFDNTELPGLPPTVAYVSANELTAKELASLTMRKLGPIVRKDYFPPNPDRLIEFLDLPEEVDPAYAVQVAHNFTLQLRRMTVDERQLVAEIFVQGCPAELPSNVHVSLDLIKRILGVPPVQSLSLLRGLKSLGFQAELRDDAEDEGDDLVVLTWDDRSSFDDEECEEFASDYSTLVAASVIQIATFDFCEEHAKAVIERLDFSELSSATEDGHQHRPLTRRT